MAYNGQQAPSKQPGAFISGSKSEGFQLLYFLLNIFPHLHFHEASTAWNSKKQELLLLV